MECLPREVVIDILSRLPVTSLLQCKLVRRAWHNLTQDPHLVDTHFYRSDENGPCLILHCDYPIRNQLYSLELSACNDGNQRVNKIRVPVWPEFDVVGSSKGLLCFCDSLTKNSLYIYNRFNRVCIKLPKSMKFPNQDGVFGFGFHPLTKEYKVVMIFYYRIPSEFSIPGEIIPPESMVQIFTLGSPAWRRLENIHHYPLQTRSQVLVNGRLHWDTQPQRYCPARLLISFDLADEEFRVILKPDCGDLDRYRYSLVVLRGCLSAAVRGNYGHCDICVMKDYDVKESWTKEFSIGIHVPRGLELYVDQSFKASKFYHNISFFRVLHLLKNGDLLLEYKRRTLVSYDPRNGTFKDHLFHGMPFWFEAIVHEGNLTHVESENVLSYLLCVCKTTSAQLTSN